MLLLVQITTGLGGSPPCLFEVYLFHATLPGLKQCYGIAKWLFVVGSWFADDFHIFAVGEGWEWRGWVMGQEERAVQTSCHLATCVLLWSGISGRSLWA